MQGYIRNTLSTANLNQTLVRKDFIPTQLMTDGLNVTQCRSVSPVSGGIMVLSL